MTHDILQKKVLSLYKVLELTLTNKFIPGGSNENLLNIRRPNQLMLPASSSGDSLDVEVRDKEPAYGRTRKSRSMVAPKQRMRSPVPAPRTLLPHTPEVFLHLFI